MDLAIRALQLDKNDKDQIKEGWEIVASTVARIRKMVMDILFCSKERKLNLERIDVRNFSQEIAKELEPKIRRQHLNFVTNREGTRPGLFVANTIIQQHGGAINVQSALGQGTVFQIEIPKQKN